MGLSLRNLGRKLWDQVNIADGGKTFNSNRAPIITRSAPQPRPQPVQKPVAPRSNFSRVFDQVNPFDNNRTYKQATPTAFKSVYQQTQPKAKALWDGFTEAPKQIGVGLEEWMHGDETLNRQQQDNQRMADILKKVQTRKNDTSLSLSQRQLQSNIEQRLRKQQQQNYGEQSKSNQEGLERLDPKKNAAAITSAAFDLATAGVGTSIKGAAKLPVKQAIKILAKQGGKAAAMGSVSGGLSPVIQKGDKVTLKDVATGAATGAVIGAALPVATYGVSKLAPKVSKTVSNTAGGLMDNPQVAQLRSTYKIMQQQYDNTPNLQSKKALSKQMADINRQIRAVDQGGYISPGGNKSKVTAFDKEYRAKLNERPANLKKIEQTTTNMSDAERLRLAKGDPGQAGIGSDPAALAQAKARMQQAIAEDKPRVKPLDESGYVQLPSKPKVKSTTPLSGVDIDPTDPFGNRGIIKRLKNELGSVVDDDSQMIAMLKKVEKQTGKKGLVDQWYFDSGNVRASTSIANAKIRNSEELSGALKGLGKKELGEFDDYVAARAELKNYDGLNTSRTPEQLQAVVQAGDAKYGQRFGSLNQYYKKMAQDMRDGGLIDDAKLQEYLASDDYVRIQRDMEDLVGGFGGSSKSRSIGSTTATQKRKGSSREVLSPTQSALKRTQQIQLEIQRNKAATNAIDVFKELGLAKEAPNSVNKNTISRIVNGQREIYEVPGDIKKVMDNVNPYQLGVLAKIVSAPTRLFRAGTTALSAPFTVTNYLRDQASSGIYSKNVIATHNPKNIIAGISSATKDFATESRSPLWKKFEEFAGDQTIFDELRNASKSKQVLREVSQGQRGKIKNMIVSPVRTLEDLNSITEKATRFQNFKGIYESTLKKTGGNVDEALRAAVLAARQNSVDFSRGSTFTRTANLLIPYFNASIQGSRNVARSFAERPVATTAKSIAGIAIPAVALATYNMADPQRREIYESINEFEKENNLILVTPWAKQRDDGTWEGIIKVPKPQGYRELTDPVREITEKFLGDKDTDSIAQMAKDMIGGLTGPINLQDGGKFVGGLIPAAAKPWIQIAMNKDLYTGGDIIGDYMLEGTDDPTKRAFDSTSGTAQMIANQLGVSPIQVERAITDTAGSIGRYGINAVDNVLAKAGVIGKDQIGGRSAMSDFSRRLFEANAELLDKNKSSGRKYFDDVQATLEGKNPNAVKAWEAIHPTRKNFLGDVLTEKSIVDGGVRAGIYLAQPEVFELDREIDRKQRERGKPGNPIFDLNDAQKQVVLSLQANKSFNPGDKAMADVIERQQPWLKGYQDKVSEYFDQIKTIQESEKAEAKKQGKKVLSDLEDVDPNGIPKPVFSDAVSRKMEAAAQITDPATKAKFYNNNPDVTETLARNEEYNRAKRAYLGLPQLDRFPQDPQMKRLEEQFFTIDTNNKAAKKAFMQANPALSDYWLKKNLWQLNEAGARARYEGEELGEDSVKDIMSIARNLENASGGGYGSRRGGGGGGGRGSNPNDNPDKYRISLSAGGSASVANTIKKPKVVAKAPTSPLLNYGKGKASLKKSKV